MLAGVWSTAQISKGWIGGTVPEREAPYGAYNDYLPLLSDFALAMQLINGFGEFYPGMILAFFLYEP